MLPPSAPGRVPVPPDAAAARESPNSPPPVGTFSATDFGSIADLFAGALADDPGFQWMFPEAESRPARVRWVQGFLLRCKAATGVRDSIGDSAAALWLPPGVSAIVPLWTELAAGIALAPLSLGLSGTLRGLKADAAVKRRLEVVKQPCWYLDTLAVGPASQGRGLGSTLLQHGLARAGETPCFLYTVKPENVPYYERFGFSVVDNAVLVEGGPPAWTMRWQRE
jgi:ribosomal protein S18 acetylase RimI-like enzyme